MVQTVGALKERLQTIKEQRKAGELSLNGYYQALLELAAALVESLGDEAEHLDEKEVRKQVPLILLFVEEQIQKFGERA